MYYYFLKTEHMYSIIDSLPLYTINITCITI